MARVWLEYGYTLLTGQRQTCEARNKRGKYSQCGNVLFPVWECFIPNVGIKFSLNPHILRSLLFLMLVLGGKAWGQDYSGTYYIGSDGNAATVNNKNTTEEYTYDVDNPSTNFYLVPASDPVQNNNKDAYFDGATGEKPFLTTYKTGHVNEALWVLTKVTDTDGTYYYIMHAETKKYVIYDPFFNDDSKRRRKCMHLDGTSPSEEGKFVIVEKDGAFGVMPKSQVDETHNYWNLADKNRNSRHGLDNSNYYGGLLGLYQLVNKKLDTNSRFKLEEVLDRPTFTSTSSHIVIGHSEGNNATIYYTIDGTNPTTTNCAGSGDAPLQIDMPDNNVTLKAIAVIDNLPSCVTEIRVVPNATITLGSSSFTYNGSAQEPTITVKDGKTPIAASEYTVGYSNNTNAGDATVTINNATGGGYIVYGSKTFTINKKALTITADSETKVYDGTALTKNTYTNTALADGDAITSVTVTGSQTVVGSSDNVPSAAVIKKGDEDRTANYGITYVKGTLTVTKKALTIIADAKSKTYGEDDPALTYTSSGLIGSDAITGALSRDAGENAGTYAINQNTLTAGDNYSIAYTGANLTINKKALTITADAKSKTYGEDDPALTYASSGLIGSDAITGALSRDAGENAGTYSINQNTLTAGNNYAIAYTGANLTINKKDLTIKADAKSKTYGDTDPTLTYTQEGLVSGDAITGTLSRDTGEDVGTYAINNTLTISTNYAITYVPANLTISQKEVGLDWSNTELVYNGTAQAPTATATGTVNDDAIAVTVTGTQTNAGEYTATASTLTGDKAGNYKLPIANTQTFTISPKSLGDGETAAEGITLDITTEGGNVVLNSVKDGEKTLVNNTDYTYDIQDEASDKIIAIAGIGNYTGSISGVYVCPVFTDADGEGAGLAAAVYQARRDFASPTGVNAYIVRSVNPTIGTLTISKLEYIPKDVPVLLLTASQASGFLTAEKDESTPAVSVGTVNSNLLKVAPTEGVPVKTAEVYMFYLGEFVLTQAGTVNAGRFYVHNPNFTDTPNAPAPAPARRSLMIVKEETTGIADLPQTENKFADDAWYTMDGRRLNGKPAKAGLYIHQGQKRVIK